MKVSSAAIYSDRYRDTKKMHNDTQPLLADASNASSPRYHTLSGGPSQRHNQPDHGKMKTQEDALIRRLRLKVDLRLCTIAGILCSLNLLDSGVISSASVTSMRTDLGLTGTRYSVSIFIFTIASICCQLPSTIAVRRFGPRRWFAFITVSFGIITMATAFARSWKQMIALRVLLGMAMSGIYPGLTYLISTWYPRREQHTRFAFLQSGQIIILATGSIANYGLNKLDGIGGLKGWQYMFLVQGLVACVFGILTYFWIVDFPEQAHKSLCFLTEEEQKLAVSRIESDRKDVVADKFAWSKVLQHTTDTKVYGFACSFFLLNLVSTSLSYFLPIILKSGMGFGESKAILLSAPPYYYAVIPVVLSSVIADKFGVRGPIITFNSLCLITGFCMLGFSSQVTVRYIGTVSSQNHPHPPKHQLIPIPSSSQQAPTSPIGPRSPPTKQTTSQDNGNASSRPRLSPRSMARAGLLGALL